MAQYIDKDALVAEIERRIKFQQTCIKTEYRLTGKAEEEIILEYKQLLSFLDTLEVKDPYEQRVQYDSIRAGIQAHAETYSFNIESKLFNQLTKEQQELWRKEIEQACISGGDMGVELARDTRYKENLEVKEVDLAKETSNFIDTYYKDAKIGYKLSIRRTAKYFFELGMHQSNNGNSNGGITMNKQVEQIKAEIERWKKELRLSTSCEAKYRREMLDDISEFIEDSLQEEPVSEELEEASEKYACRFTSSKYGHDKIKATFKDGANWQKEQEMQDRLKSDNTVFQKFYEKGKADMKEQMMKDAVDADAVFDYYDNQDRLYVSILATDVLAKKYGLKDGDKPKIIIVKEEGNESN